MPRKTATAIRRCGTDLCIIFALYCFVSTGAYASLLMGQWSFPNPFGRGSISLSLAGAVVFAVFFYLDYLSLTDDKLDWGQVKKPTRYPLEYALVRRRRYALIPFVLLYVMLAFRLVGSDSWFVTKKDPAVDMEKLYGWTLVLFGGLFAVSRRPLSWVPTKAIDWAMDLAAGAAGRMGQGR